MDSSIEENASSTTKKSKRTFRLSDRANEHLSDARVKFTKSLKN